MSASEVNMPRQDFEDVYIPNGYVDIVRWENIINGSFWGDNMYVFETPMCHEVDSEEQLEICQVIASNKESEFNGSSS